MTEEMVNLLNTTALAYVGDAAYEVVVREKIIERFPKDAGRAHKAAVKYVSAAGQAKAARTMIEAGFLTEDEERLLKRARNHRSMSRPQHADPKDYKYATGFEALIGYLHLMGRSGRIDEIVTEAFRIIDSAERLSDQRR